MHQPLVSIVTPAYNAGNFIAETIESVLNQSYNNWELVIIDDGSIDNTRQVVGEYLVKDSRIKYFYQDNAKQGVARNNGIRKSKGNYIAFLDADDLWESDKLLLQVKEMQIKNIDLVFADSFYFNGKFNPSINYPVMEAGQGFFSGQDGIKAFLDSNRIPILTVLVTRESLTKVNFFTENLSLQNAEDYHLWLRLLLSNCIFYGMPKVLAAYREHSTSVSGSDRLNLPYALRVKADILSLYPQYSDLILPSINKTVIKNLNVAEVSSGSIFFEKILSYLELSKKSRYKPLFNFFKVFNANKLALKASYFIFNYL